MWTMWLIKDKQKVFHVNILAKFHKAEQPETNMDSIMEIVQHHANI